MLKNILVSFLLMIFIFSCEKELQDAQEIIDKSIEVSGGNLLKNSNIEFDFRDTHYYAKRHNRGFLLARVSVVNSDSIVDLLSNKNFEREINGAKVKLIDSMIPKYSASVNSVHYFSVLPYGLDGKAVKKRYLGVSKLKGTDYHKIEITFNEEGGGEDFDDVFIYWVNKETFKVDYLAYSFHEENGLGLRFREAYNERYVKGVRFVDYRNYKPKEADETLENLDVLYETDALSLLSSIELKNIKVQ